MNMLGFAGWTVCPNYSATLVAQGGTDRQTNPCGCAPGERLHPQKQAALGVGADPIYNGLILGSTVKVILEAGRCEFLAFSIQLSAGWLEKLEGRIIPEGSLPY